MDWSNSLEQEFRKQVAEGHHRQEWRSPRQRLCDKRVALLKLESSIAGKSSWIKL